MRKYASYITGGIIVVLMFLFGIASRPEAKPDELARVQAEYQRIAELYRVEATHCSIAEQYAQQLLLIHGEAERIRSRQLLTASLEAKKE